MHHAVILRPANEVMASTSSNKVKLAMQVPADAVVYLAGQKMTLTGTQRLFVTPALETGKTFQYPIRVEMVQNGQPVVLSATQPIRAGQTIELVVSGNQIAQKPGQNVQPLVQVPAAEAQLTAQK